ncbi:hypothetical protein [Providencia sp. PROV117]|uniref:hypothetical protein n=1 Tax=Providencia sp. PROV117 TaxID=2949828 RepID=UPI00234AA40A|nr:hypothetical protein [Providencia sp. PROV117]
MDSIQISGLIINVLMMLIAIMSSFISYLIYKDNSSPDVIVYLELDKDAKTLLNLVIKNIGKSPAKNVTFKLDRKLPQFAHSNSNAEEMIDGALFTGIPFLAPGASRVSMIGDYHGLDKWFQGKGIRVETAFYKANNRSILNKLITNESFLEIYSFKAVSSADNSAKTKIVNELRNINKSLSKISK